MAIGQMNKRVQLQEPQTSTEVAGGQDVGWRNVEKVWASLQPISASEQLYALGMTNPITHRMTIRYREDIATTWRITFGERVFNIRSIINVEERNRFLQLSVEEGLATL